MVAQVRCVSRQGDRYLLIRRKQRWSVKFGKWELPGGALEPAEAPETGVRRKLAEQNQSNIRNLVFLGDWEYRGEVHRVFSCQFEGAVGHAGRTEHPSFVWLTVGEIVTLAKAGKLCTGFELAAITRAAHRARQKGV